MTSASTTAPTATSKTVLRRILLPQLEDGWDEEIAEEDRGLVYDLLSHIRELARFRQPRMLSPAPAPTPSHGTILDTNLLRGIFGAEPRADKDDMDHDGGGDLDQDDSDDGADDSVEYIVSARADSQCYIVNVLLPRDTIVTADRLGILCALSPSLILPNFIDWGIDRESLRPYMNVRVNRRSNPMHFQTRLVIIEQLGAAPAVRTSSGLPFADGVSVRRTHDGTVINNYGTSRSNKRARPNGSG